MSICITIMLLLYTCLVSWAQDTLNPLKGDIRLHDPVMIKQGNTYYVFHTGKGTSKDKINWKRAGSIFPVNKQSS